MRYNSNMLKTIEDCLETIAGLRDSHSNLNFESEEFTIMNSISRQVFRGTALTDRQHALVKEKLTKYIPMLEAVGYENVERAIEGLRNPIRQINRSKFIKLVDAPTDFRDRDEKQVIAIRFPFKKSDIVLINEIQHSAQGYHHVKGEHVHYFSFTENNLLQIGDRFFQKDYEIDPMLKEKYQQIKTIKSNPNEYLPYIENNKLKNIKPELQKIIENETDNDIVKIYDRRFRYCLDNITVNLRESNLEGKIASRNELTYLSKPSAENIDTILYALYNLDRFPMLVVLHDDIESQLHEVLTFFRDLISTEHQCVLFRTEEKESGFNQLIKDRNLNNWLDNDTKIVYINSNKLPKLLLETSWRPNCTFAYNSNNNKHVQFYIKNNCDLIVHREETVSPFTRMFL